MINAWSLSLHVASGGEGQTLPASAAPPPLNFLGSPSPCQTHSTGPKADF